MATYSGNNVKVGPGTLYAAPLGTSEPAAVTGAWPAGWVALGYTDGGSQFSHNPSTANVEVEEELIPIKIVTTGVVQTMTFSLAEVTAKAYLLALNAGLVNTPGTPVVAGTTGSNPDGSIWVEPPALGTELRVMLGWDALPEAAATGVDPFGRLIMRQCFQTGTVQEQHRKGNNKTVYACTFSLEKPAGAQPFRKIYPLALSG